MVTFTQSKTRKGSRPPDDKSRFSPDLPGNTSYISEKSPKKPSVSKSFAESKSQGDSLLSKEAKLAEITEEVKSKERSLALLEESLPGDPASKQLLGQLQLRDKRIEELTGRIQETETQLAAISLDSHVAKERQISMLQDERTKLLKEIQGLEEHSSSLEIQLNSVQRELTELKENSELLQEGLSEELEQVKTDNTHKDEMVKSAKQDIFQLSKIVAEMSKLNSELNEKILTQNAEVEKLNAAHYQANITAMHADELEVMYTDLRSQYQKSLNKNKKLNEENARLRLLEDASRLSQEKLRSVEESLAPALDSASLIDLIQKVRHDLKSHTTVKKTVPEDAALFKQEITELKETIKDLTGQLHKATNSESVHIDRIKALETEKVTVKGQLEEAVDRLQRRIKVLQESHDRYKAKSDQFEQDTSKSDTELQKVSNQVSALQSQVSMLKANRKEVAQVETKLQATIRDLKAHVTQLKTQKATQESSLNAREQRLKATAIKLKVLTDEIWRRETEIMKLRRAVDKAEDEVSRRKSNEQVTHAQAKSKIAEEMTSVNGQLEEKDREIAILRDMVRGMQQQIKTKDNELTRLKRKYESDPVREIPPSISASPEPALPKLAYKIDSSIKEIEDLIGLKQKLEKETKVPPGVVKKLLQIDPIPKDKSQVLRETMRRLGEAMESFNRLTGSKLGFSISSDHLGGNASSGVLQEMLQGEGTVGIEDVVGRVKSLS